MDIIILEKSRVRSYLDSIAAGFAKNPLEVVLSLTAIGLFILSMVLVLVWWNRKEKIWRDARTEKAFEALSQKAKLTLSEKELVRTMAQYGPNGKKSVNQVMTNIHLFNTTAGNVIKRGIVSERTIAALRFRLGHHMNEKRGVLRSTVELTPGSFITAKTGKNEILAGEIKENGPARFSIAFPEQTSLSGYLVLSIPRKTGLYRCKVYVLGGKNGTYDVQHTENIQRIQKRSALRRKLKLIVRITYQPDNGGAIEDTLEIRGRITELSETGALISSTALLPEKDTKIHLSFLKDQNDSVEVEAVVVRWLEDINTIAVRFIDIPAKVQERIMKKVFH